MSSEIQFCIPISSISWVVHAGGTLGFAAGNFSCLHLLARCLQVQGVSWLNVPSFADYFPAVHVVNHGNWRVPSTRPRWGHQSRSPSSVASVPARCISVPCPTWSYISRHLQWNSDHIPLPAPCGILWPCGPEPAGFSTCRI